jgi:hypothetical protein
VDGNCTMLAADVAKDITKPVPGLFHCTESKRG